MIKLRKLRCSFCRKNESAVARLVAGPRVYICDECVAIANRIMESDGPHDPGEDLPLEFTGQRPHQGHSPSEEEHGYGGAEPPPHIRRRSRSLRA